MNTRDIARPFEFLNYIPAADVVSSVYYALRLIKHRSQFGPDQPISLIAEGIPSEPTIHNRKTALRILHIIVELEDSPLPRLSKNAADNYMSLLSDIALNRMREDFQIDLLKGEKLLLELRAQSTPHPSLISENGVN